MESVTEQFDPDAVFRETRDEFLNSLPWPMPGGIRMESPEKMFEEVKKMPAVAGSSPLRRSMDKVKSLSDALTPYFDVVGIFIQSNPESAALVWGAVRMVLQLASNFSSFFEKLADTLSRIGTALPQYRYLLNILQSKFMDPTTTFHTSKSPEVAQAMSLRLSVRIKKSICLLYRDILNFFLAVIRIFAKKDGSPKSSARIAPKLFWMPYDLLFKDLLEQFNTHQVLLETEIKILSLQKVDQIERLLQSSMRATAIERLRVRLSGKTTDQRLDTVEKAAYDTHREIKLSQLKSWLHAPQFAQDFENALETREEGTADWLFSEPCFQQWKSFHAVGSIPTNQSKSQLWIHGSNHLQVMISITHTDHTALRTLGNPGCGKTVAAASTVEYIKECSPDLCSCYFFFRTGSERCEHPIDALSSILTQALHHYRASDELIDKFIFAMDEGRSGQPYASKRELEDLLMVCVNGQFIHYIILDAIDECVQGEDFISRLFEITTRPVAMISSPNTAVPGDTPPSPESKLLAFSRPHLVGLSELFGMSQIAVRNRAAADVRLFLSRKVGELKDKGLLPASVDVSGTVSRLATRANGMFLWARLMVNYLSSPVLNSRKRLRELNHVVKPEGIDAMYDRIINLLINQNAEERKFVRWILMWLASARRDLSGRELHETLRVMELDADPEDLLEYEDFGDAVITRCSALVERLPTESDGSSRVSDPRVSYRLIHLSVREYLLSSPSNSLRQFLGTSDGLALTLSRSCFVYLVRHMPRTNATADNASAPISSQRMQALSPLYPYLTEFWVSHLPVCVPRPGPQTARLLAEVGQLGHLYSDFLSSISDFLFSKLSLLSFIEGLYIFIQHADARRRIVEDLELWARQARDTLSRGPAPNRPHASMCDGFIKLADYLRNLDMEWGTTLTSDPHSIWDDVLLFNPCPLLPDASSSTAHALAPRAEVRFSDHLSSKQLFQLSEVSNDGHYLAVLSIWPSRYLNSLYNTSMDGADIPRLYGSLLRAYGDEAYSSKKLESACFGWAILFELHDITASPRQVLKHWIQLDENEVSIQHCHSLSNQKLQFPASISPCGHKFSVLREVFAVTPNWKTTGHREARIVKTRLPLSFDHCFDDLWSVELRTSGVNTRTERKWDVSNNLYHYWLGFDQTGTMLFFTDRTAKKYGHRHLVVFHLKVSNRTVEAFVTSPPKTYCHWESEPITTSRHCFHPQQKPLIAFTVAGTALMWNFDPGSHNIGKKGKDKVLQAENDDMALALYPFHATPRAVEGFGRLWLYPQFSSYEGIGFSKCGDHLVLEEYQPNTPYRSEGISRRPGLPTVVKIPEHILVGAAVLQTQDPATIPEDLASGSLKQNSRSGLGLVSSSVGAVRTRDVRIDKSGNINSTSITIDKGVMSVRQQATSQDGPSRESSIVLTRMPDSWQSSLDMTEVMVQQPEARNDIVQLIINKAPKLSYSMAGSVDAHLPAVIERDIETLVKKERNTAVVAKPHKLEGTNARIEDADAATRTSATRIDVGGSTTGPASEVVDRVGDNMSDSPGVWAEHGYQELLEMSDEEFFGTYRSEATTSSADTGTSSTSTVTPAPGASIEHSSTSNNDSGLTSADPPTPAVGSSQHTDTRTPVEDDLDAMMHVQARTHGPKKTRTSRLFSEFPGKFRGVSFPFWGKGRSWGGAKGGDV